MLCLFISDSCSISHQLLLTLPLFSPLFLSHCMPLDPINRLQGQQAHNQPLYSVSLLPSTHPSTPLPISSFQASCCLYHRTLLLPIACKMESTQVHHNAIVDQRTSLPSPLSGTCITLSRKGAVISPGKTVPCSPNLHEVAGHKEDKSITDEEKKLHVT